jgi:hypothetical protein
MYRSSESYALNKLRRSLVFVAIGYGYFLVASWRLYPLRFRLLVFIFLGKNMDYG